MVNNPYIQLIFYPSSDICCCIQTFGIFSFLFKRLNALTDRNCELEEDLLRVQEELALQRSRLQEVQVRHAEELEELRKGGHDALALVVDQYKVTA